MTVSLLLGNELRFFSGALNLKMPEKKPGQSRALDLQKL